MLRFSKTQYYFSSWHQLPVEILEVWFYLDCSVYDIGQLTDKWLAVWNVEAAL